MNKKNLIWILLIFLISCQKNYDGMVPDTNWSLFNSADATSLLPQTRVSMQGVYQVSDGSGTFGNQVVLKWSSVEIGQDTSYHLSIFCCKDIAFFIMEGKKLGDSLIFNGYWHKLSSAQTGIARFTISASQGANQLMNPSPVIGKDSIIMNGLFGNGQDLPSQNIVFSYLRNLYQGPSFDILAHRAGGRTSDLLPYSENSVGMIRFAEQLGATGIEIDVRYTKDKVPILYHDNTLNLRLIQKNGLVGPIEDYTYDQLNTYVTLIDGEKIPTLEEALDAVVYNTSLHFVWLDTKYKDSIDRVAAIQATYIQKAAAAGRQLEIVIGLPGQDQLDYFLNLPNYTSIPSLCELSLDDVQNINSKYWAPRFTLGLQNDQVAIVHGEGRKAFVWTLDVPDLINQFIEQGNFDGILSNYASLVAYNYYVKE
jgi:glycerophosphoryl diester phosphodiesterase